MEEPATSQEAPGPQRRGRERSAILVSVRSFLQSPLPWHGTTPFHRFVAAASTITLAILAAKIALNAPVRLQVYVVEVFVIFLLGFVVLEGKRARLLESGADRADLVLAAAFSGALLGWNAFLGRALGVSTSVEPGFGDAIVLILILFVATYGRNRVRPMVAPLALLVVLAGITVFISDEQPTFYEFVGRHFVSLTIWMSAAVLQLQGYSVAVGDDFFRIVGSPSLRVEVGIRCGGLDVATVYSILIAAFAWRTRLGFGLRAAVVASATLGAFLLNALRVAFLTTLFLAYPPDLVEAFHTNLGDLIFLGYAVPFILLLNRYRA